MPLLIKNIKQLVGVRTQSMLLKGNQLSELPLIDNAFLIVENNTIASYGPMDALPKLKFASHEIYDATGRMVLPAWCDSHTHLVFAGSREDEFVDKIKGLSYTEIAAKGGGILNSARKLAEVGEEELFAAAWNRLEGLKKMGTGSVEIKSGYGLTVAAELKILRVIKRLKEKSPMNIKATFLGAHAYPTEFRDNHDAYIQQITEEMLPIIAHEKLADYIDVFCETGFFSVEEMERICLAGQQYGLRPKLHVNQLNSIGGIQKSIELNALSVDHLETMTEQDISDLSRSNVIGTLLPSAAFFLRMNFQPARKLIESGCAIALATDYNPGSSPSGNMNFLIALSCIQMKMLPEEAINAATLNGAYAMGLSNVTGSVTVGKRADLIITQQLPSLNYLPYAFGSNNIENILINGEFVN